LTDSSVGKISASTLNLSMAPLMAIGAGAVRLFAQHRTPCPRCGCIRSEHGGYRCWCSLLHGCSWR